MSRVVLHIGTHKTGTTAVQQVLNANRLLLADQGIQYPDFGTGADHHGLLRQWLPKLPSRYDLPEEPDKILADLNAQFSQTNATVVLSSEEFSRGAPKHRVNLSHIRELLRDFVSIEVICTLRPQLTYLQSIFAEMARRGDIRHWDTFFQNSVTSDYASGLFLDFNGLDDHLLKSFSPSEITYLDYDSLRRQPGGTPSAILQHLGYQGALEDLVWPFGGEVNSSNPQLAIWITAKILQSRTADFQLFPIVQSALDAHFGPNRPTTLYTRQQQKFCLTKFEPLNEVFRSRLAARSSAVPALKMTEMGEDMVFRDMLPTQFWLNLARGLYEKIPT